MPIDQYLLNDKLEAYLLNRDLVEEESAKKAQASDVPPNNANKDEINAAYEEAAHGHGEEPKPSKKTVDILNDDGNCAGWGFIHGDKTSNGLRDQFFEMLEFLRDNDFWDMEKSQENFLKTSFHSLYLDDITKLPKVQIFLEHLINDLSLFQRCSITVDTKYFNNLTGYTFNNADRLRQYGLVGNRTLRSVHYCQFPAMTPIEMAEMFERFAQYGDVYIDLGFIKPHLINVTVKNGLFYYFDANLEEAVDPVADPRALLPYLHQSRMKLDIPITRSNIYRNIEFAVYKFYPKNTPASEIPDLPRPVSPLKKFIHIGFNDLQVAILSNDEVGIRKYLKKENHAMWLVRNKHGFHAFDLLSLNHQLLFKCLPFMIKAKLFEHLFPKRGLSMRCFYESTVLHITTRENQTELMKQILANTVKVDVKNESRETPLYIAAHNGHTQAIQLLVNGGANINAKTKSGFTPLYAATMNGHTEAAKALVKLGADKRFATKKCGKSNYP